MFGYQVYNLRDFAVKGQVDDYPYGGGTGMVLKIEPLVRALATIQETYPDSYLILLSPQGRTFKQKDVPRLLNHEQISIGEFVTMGGEIPALLITEALIRAIPGVIELESYQQETFFNSQLDFAAYTRPKNFNDFLVPEVLLSGCHKKIAEWRTKNSQEKTQQQEKKYKNSNKIVLNPNL
ncbi:4406_t:CDS:2 [Ambispora leptoticha]|uniref:tRNA (guanine-N(1)-)-methyltransferase n=1 Tax=Ambispora leptoticha TaxID=144679 RepID=A0A9N8ZIL9_9GLOM|nr:4406_t:CDS:2 [Ambispora leptoticha]